MSEKYTYRHVTYGLGFICGVLINIILFMCDFWRCDGVLDTLFVFVFISAIIDNVINHIALIALKILNRRVKSWN